MCMRFTPKQTDEVGMDALSIYRDVEVNHKTVACLNSRNREIGKVIHQKAVVYLSKRIILIQFVFKG